MTSAASRWRTFILILGCWWMSGCSQWFDNTTDEEKNPLVTDARAKKAAYNYAGAIESLERALEANPHLALAHWELGLIDYQNTKDYAAAIYHFEKLLKLRPDWKQADTAKQFINVCKIELANSVPLAPQTPQVQRELDKLTAKQLELTKENRDLKDRLQAYLVQAQRLTLENSQLRQQLQAWQVAASRASTVPAAAVPPPALMASNRSLGGPRSPTSTVTAPNRTAASARPASSDLAAGSPGAAGTPILAAKMATPVGRAQTHTVRSGETPVSIARQYGIRLSDLLKANPGLEPRRLKVGQVLRLPGS